ncbi:hypothetical protein Kole_1333 [Kosmotoga olearia TBF 19.5.1]|uniref:Uncharacterized protein n=1 Tax=Kosmotoga olearia (strain ATCC BAA-1733 / DSM 21960 / TBF 19.5.1) TaxID=521045 RepID=C5CDL5_KOSOT|nr:hypothetical protein Kole_1333 [Kosmotoga olearia TBF 19.5.1]
MVSTFGAEVLDCVHDACEAVSWWSGAHEVEACRR